MLSVSDHNVPGDIAYSLENIGTLPPNAPHNCDTTSRGAKQPCLHSSFNVPSNAVFAACESDPTFSELLSLWAASNELRLKGGTKHKYETLINSHILPKLGDIRLSRLNTKTINSYLTEKLYCGRLDGCGGLSPSYVRSISFVISAAIQYGVDAGLCQPLKGKICKPSVSKKELPILSLAQQRILERKINAELTPTSVGVMISLYTGLRIGEVCALKWSDIDFETETIYVRHTVSRIKSPRQDSKTVLILDEPKTASSKRILPIPSPLLTVLKIYRHVSNSPFVISDTETFVSPRTYDVRYHKIMSACHLEKMNYHALRHTFATRCVEVGVDIKSLSEILGHANTSITLNTYVHSSIEMKRMQIKKLSLLVTQQNDAEDGAFK